MCGGGVPAEAARALHHRRPSERTGEAKHQLQLRRVLPRWSRYDLIAIEVGYVPLAEVGAEFLFQVVAERAEKAAVILTMNLPFPEWTQVIPNARLCKALLDPHLDPHHRPGAHPGDRDGIVPFPAHGREAEVRSQSELNSESCGNAGPWKAWKTNPRFSTLSTALGNR